MPGASSPMLGQSATIRSAPGLAMPCPLISETFGVMASEARAGPPGRRKVSMRGHERRRATASRVRSAEFQGFPPGLSVVEPPMSAVWTPRCSRIAGRRWTPTVHVLKSATARGPGCTGQGLCVLHETPNLAEYTHLAASRTQTLYSTHRFLRCHDIRNPQKPRDNTVGRRRRRRRPVPSKPLPLRCPPCLPALPLPTRSLPRRRHRPCHSPIRLSPRRRTSSPGTTPTPATCRGAAPEQRRGRSSSRRS